MQKQKSKQVLLGMVLAMSMFFESGLQFSICSDVNILTEYGLVFVASGQDCMEMNLPP